MAPSRLPLFDPWTVAHQASLSRGHFLLPGDLPDLVTEPTSPASPALQADSLPVCTPCKVLHSICQQIWKTLQWPQDWKGQFSFQSQRKAMPKNAQTTAQLHSSHMLVKKCSKFSKSGFNNTWTVNFKMFKLILEKAEEPEIKLPTSTGSSKKQESSRKTSILLYWLCQSLWLCGSQ